MKIDRARLKKSTSEVPAECQALINRLRACQHDHTELLAELQKVVSWTYGKCELYHWIDILDIGDTILEGASARVGTSWTLACDLPENVENKDLLLWVLHFTTLLIEHSFSRHLYSSMEHLITLLQSCNLNVVLGVLNLLYMFSKRSNFLTRIANDKRQALLTRLTYLAESWGGKENGFGLADCSRKDPLMDVPKSVTTLDFEYHIQQPSDCPGSPRAGSSKANKSATNLQVIHVENLNQMGNTAADIMDTLLATFNVPDDRQVQLFTRIRLACNFPVWPARLLIVQARLQALSVLVYSNALADNAHTLLYTGLLEELVELLELQQLYLVEIRAAALRTLTSIIHLDRNPHFPKKPGSRLGMIIEVTGAGSYHGFLPAMVRSCISSLTAEKRLNSKVAVMFPLPLATALFSFLYHLASYEAGGEALVSCGMMESLLRVINWLGKELEHITFVTRAVRVIDLITNMDMQAFQIHGGLSSFIRRLEMEVNICRVEQPFEIVVPSHFNEQVPQESPENMDTSTAGPSDTSNENATDESVASDPAEVVEDVAVEEVAGPSGSSTDPDTNTPPPSASSSGSGDPGSDVGPRRLDYGATATGPALQLARLMGRPVTCNDRYVFDDSPFPEPKRPPKRLYGFGGGLPDFSASKTGKTCLPQRAALLKSMLNFLKKAIQDPAFTESIRHVMEGTLPSSLKHIISNAEYYGPSLFLLATDVVTVYVFQEPSLLSSLQDNGLTDIVLHALLIKDVPATREVLGSLPNVFSALCLNARGLESFVKCEPFERLFKVLLSPAYLTAMRRRRSSDPLGDTAGNLGNAMDELMRHQPLLKVDATYAMIRLLEELNSLGNNPNYVCWRATKGVSDTPTLAMGNNSGGTVPNDTGSSDDEDDDEDEASSSSHPQREESAEGTGSSTSTERTPIALIDYIVNVMKFIDAILSNNSTDDHCKEFVKQNGLPPLMTILALKNLPVDYPITVSAQAVASVCKSILNLAHEPNVLKIAMHQMNEMIEMLLPLNDPITLPGGSILLRELANAPNLETAFSTASSTPMLHAVNAMHSYITTYIHTCRTGQNEIRAISLAAWGCPMGIECITGLANMYISVLWESNNLLALCTEDVVPLDSGFAAEDLARLRPSDAVMTTATSAMEALSTDPSTHMEVDDGEKPKEGSRMLPTPAQLKYIKTILAVVSRLARSLAELFGLLVKLCVGSPVRARRGQQAMNQPMAGSPFTRAIAGSLNKLVARALSWEKLPPTVIPKFTLTFLICSVGFASPMLFDDKKYPYHLMLHKFLKHGGQQTFFNSIRWALSGGNAVHPDGVVEYTVLPEGTGDFLVSSLTLLEKLVNPKAILDSPHGHSGPRSTTFDSTKYLMNMHQEAFKTIMQFWGKKPLKCYTDHMCEPMLSILRHILRGEKIMMDRIEKEIATAPPESGDGEAGPSGNTGNGQKARQERTVNPADLQRLMEMGFAQGMCMEALQNTSAVDQAMEYILNSRSVANAEVMEVAEEEDQVNQAILLSLGGKAPAATNTKSSKSRIIQLKEDFEIISKFKKVIDAFTDTALTTCLELLDVLPDLVFRVCELLVTITKRNGEDWRDNMLVKLIIEIVQTCDYLMAAIENGPSPSDVVRELVHSTEALQASVRIHLFTLLFEGPLFNEMQLPCAKAAQRLDLIPMLVRLVGKTEDALTQSSEQCTPKWLAPVLLLIDQYEQISTVTKRKERMHQVTTRHWRWFDLSTGKWTAYSVANNRLINEAYWQGENTVRISCGRRRYTVQFHVMLQVNEESGNRRPITMSLLERDHIPATGEEHSAFVRAMEESRNSPVEGLESEDSKSLVKACVGLLSLPVDKLAVHAVMRICLRLTQNYENAVIFAKEGGIQSLLNLTFSAAFAGFLNLATLLIRHVVEEPALLGLAFEKVLRGRTVGNIPPPYKELVYMLRNTSAAATRDPQTFLEVARRVLRIDCSLSRRGDEDLAKDFGRLLKTVPPREIPATQIGDVAAEALTRLLNALVKSSPKNTDMEPCASMTGASGSLGNLSVAQNPVQLARPPNAFTPHVSMIFSTFRQNASHILGVTDEAIIEREFIRKRREDINNSEEEKKRPLLPRSAILKLLADTVRSYSGCAKLIVDHMYYEHQADLVGEDCTALAFILDNLLPVGECSEDRECSTTSRMLIAAIASCNHCADAQLVLVAEVRNSLVRAFALPESTKKHAQIQLIAGLVSTMVENCPQNPPVPQPTFTSALMRASHYNHTVNNMVRIINNKRLFTDLARVAHHLDLSSPNMAATLNATLKPLETLSRIINQPTASVAKPKPKSRNAGELSLDESIVSEGDGTRDEPELGMAEDDPSSAHPGVIGEERAAVLNLMVNRMLEHSVTAPQDGDSNQMDMDTDTDHNPIAGLNDSNPLFDNDTAAEEDTQDSQSSESESESNEEASDGDALDETREVDEDEDDGEDNDDDEDDEEEEEEGGSGYEEDGLEFFESGEGLFRLPGLDRDNEDILMIQYADGAEAAPGMANLVPWNSSSFPLPFGIFEDPANGNENADGGLVDGLGNLTTPPHPLLLNRHHLESANLPVGPRSQRNGTNRQRRYQFLHLNSRHQNPPVILQRLLGSAEAASGHNGQAAGPAFRDARVVVMDNGLGIFGNTEEEQIDFVDQSGYLFGPSLSATLNNPPTALHWWIEEAKLLDGESQPDCVMGIAFELVPELEKHKDVEMEARKESKPKRHQEDEVKRTRTSAGGGSPDDGNNFVLLPSSSTRSVPEPDQSRDMEITESETSVHPNADTSIESLVETTRQTTPSAGGARRSNPPAASVVRPPAPRVRLPSGLLDLQTLPHQAIVDIDPEEENDIGYHALILQHQQRERAERAAAALHMMRETQSMVESNLPQAWNPFSQSNSCRNRPAIATATAPAPFNWTGDENAQAPCEHTVSTPSLTATNVEGTVGPATPRAAATQEDDDDFEMAVSEDLSTINEFFDDIGESPGSPTSQSQQSQTLTSTIEIHSSRDTSPEPVSSQSVEGGNGRYPNTPGYFGTLASPNDYVPSSPERYVPTLPRGHSLASQLADQDTVMDGSSEHRSSTECVPPLRSPSIETTMETSVEILKDGNSPMETNSPTLEDGRFLMFNDSTSLSDSVEVIGVSAPSNNVPEQSTSSRGNAHFSFNPRGFSSPERRSESVFTTSTAASGRQSRGLQSHSQTSDDVDEVVVLTPPTAGGVSVRRRRSHGRSLRSEESPDVVMLTPPVTRGESVQRRRSHSQMLESDNMTPEVVMLPQSSLNTTNSLRHQAQTQAECDEVQIVDDTRRQHSRGQVFGCDDVQEVAVIQNHSRGASRARRVRRHIPSQREIPLVDLTTSPVERPRSPISLGNNRRNFRGRRDISRQILAESREMAAAQPSDERTQPRSPIIRRSQRGRRALPLRATGYGRSSHTPQAAGGSTSPILPSRSQRMRHDAPPREESRRQPRAPQSNFEASLLNLSQTLRRNEGSTFPFSANSQFRSRPAANQDSVFSQTSQNNSGSTSSVGPSNTEPPRRRRTPFVPRECMGELSPEHSPPRYMSCRGPQGSQSLSANQVPGTSLLEGVTSDLAVDGGNRSTVGRDLITENGQPSTSQNPQNTRGSTRPIMVPRTVFRRENRLSQGTHGEIEASQGSRVQSSPETPHGQEDDHSENSFFTTIPVHSSLREPPPRSLPMAVHLNESVRNPPSSISWTRSEAGPSAGSSPPLRLPRIHPLTRLPLAAVIPAPTPPATSRVNVTVEDEYEEGEIVDEEPSTSAGTSELPEGVDPSFLAALPEEMRHEVLSEHIQLQRLLQQSQSEGEPPLTDVNPEFLAALPPSIQEEVLAQQRQELQRQAAITANPEDPVDAAAFFENLPGPLRQAILTDMEDSQIAVLPPNLALEAQGLRREWESRNRQLMQERILSHQHHGNSALTSILRNSGPGRGPRYTFHTVPPHGNAAMANGWHSRADSLPGPGGLGAQGPVRVRGKNLLDHESLSCLMVLLFVDEPKLNTGRLHRVLRNLCYHSPTRDWVVKTLISVMERCNESRVTDVVPAPRRRMSTRSQGAVLPSVPSSAYLRNPVSSWLNISLEAALGCRASVFSLTRNQGKRASKGQEVISIHPQAAQVVFRHALEVLISLAKSFPAYFLPYKKDDRKEGDSSCTESKKPSSTSTSTRASRTTSTDFWELLVKLDSVSGTKKGKFIAMARTNSVLLLEGTEPTPPASFETCAFGLLVQMLATPVVKRSPLLTDKLLRLLSLISIGLPDCQNNLTIIQGENALDEIFVRAIVVPEHHLRLAVEVLTTKSCSEDGLEDITALLLNLSATPESTRHSILRLLLEGARCLANVVNDNIATLLAELKAMNEQLKRELQLEPETPAIDRERTNRGVVQDRFTHNYVVVSAPTKPKGGCDLQLPSMSVLTMKTSSQAFFLRVLKIIVQIRENMLPLLKKKREERDLFPELMSTVKEEDLVLPPLSEQLPLDFLWNTLGDCLTELNDAPDHHAVLVLQPAVEAFFIVHAALTEARPEAPGGDEAMGGPEDMEEAFNPSGSVQPTPPSNPRASGSGEASSQASLERNVAPVSPLQPDGEPGPPVEQSGAQTILLSTLASLGLNLESSPQPPQLPPDQQKFLKFAETHRTVLNQILRQSNTHLADGPFAVLVDHTRVLDFDVKRRYFRAEMERKDEGVRREELAVHVRRSNVFEDSFRELHRRQPDEWKNRFYIVFEGEEGQDAGGLLREWYLIISREIFNPMYALFTTSQSDRVTYMINPASHCNPNHLSYFKFVGRVIAKAVYDNKLLECYFTRSFYKHILGILVKFSDMENEDYVFYQGLIFLMDHHVNELGYDLTFTAEVQVFGAHETRELIPDGGQVRVTEDNKFDYIRRVCKMKMADAISKQIQAFLEGFYEIIPKRLISIFNEQELELLVSGLPNIDIEDLKSNTEYHKYLPNSLQIQWFWRALRSFDQADRAKFLQFVTGTSKVPLQGFGSLEGMNGVQRFQIHRDDRSTDRLPSAHTCFNQLDLPVYETYVKLSSQLLKAIHECSEGFGFA